MTRNDVEKHFNAPRSLDIRFKEALAKSEFSTEAEFFRFHVMQLVERFEGLKKKRRPPCDKSHPRGRRDE